MRIKKITVRNYRSIDPTGIEINIPDIKLPISIVGHNNSGKSNFVGALGMCLGAKPFSRNTFSANDFYCKDTTEPILVEALVDDPLKSSNAYNQVKDMPLFQLKVKNEEGVFSVGHYFCEEDGKPIFNPRSINRSKTKYYTDKEKAVLNETQKQGAEQVWKWKTKTPIYFIDTPFIQDQLRINNYTLLGKVMEEVKADFESDSNLVPKKDGIAESHIGQPRKKVFENTMQYLEKHILSTDNLESLISQVEEVVKKQLEIENDDISLRFGFPNADAFFDNLTFYITDNPKKPKLPIDQMGKGFSSLFVVALFRAILSTTEGGNIFIIEEPETFLHEHFQEYFYQVLCDLSQNNQVIYTTHSKKFVNIFEPKSIIKLKNVGYLKSEVVYKDEPTISTPTEIDGYELKNPDDFAKYMATLEPNLGNIIFASKVVIVEGAHDLLAYKTILSQKINFGLNNVAIVASWGKDSILAVIQLCQRFDIPFFVIHDWDLTNEDTDITQPNNEQNAVYSALDGKEKGQYTRNHKIYELVGDATRIHQNKINLEGVLGIPATEKGAISVYEKIKGKSFEDICKEFPKLLSPSLLSFLEIA